MGSKMSKLRRALDRLAVEEYGYRTPPVTAHLFCKLCKERTDDGDWRRATMRHLPKCPLYREPPPEISGIYRRPTAPEVGPLIDAYYNKPGNGAGGHLHVVLDDGNYDDRFILGSMMDAAKANDVEAYRLGAILLTMSKTQRAKAKSWQVKRARADRMFPCCGGNDQHPPDHCTDCETLRPAVPMAAPLPPPPVVPPPPKPGPCKTCKGCDGWWPDDYLYNACADWVWCPDCHPELKPGQPKPRGGV